MKSEFSKEKAAVVSGTRPENAGRIKEVRRTIARILTIQKEPGKKAAEKTTTKKEAKKESEVVKKK